MKKSQMKKRIKRLKRLLRQTSAYARQLEKGAIASRTAYDRLDAAIKAMGGEG